MFDFLKREIRVTRNIDECNKIRGGVTEIKPLKK